MIDETTGEVLEAEPVRLKRSPSIGAIADALAKAQAEITAAEKSQSNPAFKRGNKESRYADLAAVYDACRAPLAKNGIAVIQSPSANGAYVTVTTLLAHASGEWFEGALTMRSRDESPHGLGGCITYARRYALSALAGVAPADDDDGNQASGKSAPAVPPLVVEAPDTRPPAPKGAVYVDRLEKRKDSAKNFEFADVLLSNGWPVFAKGNLVAYLEQVLQNHEPIVITTRKTKKGNTEIATAVRWQPPEPEPVAPAAPPDVKDIVF